jgi:hypothetical protein
VLLFGLALMVGGACVLVGFRNYFELGRLLPAGRARRLAVGLDAGLGRLGAGLRVVGAGAALGRRRPPPARRPAPSHAAAGRAVGRVSVPGDDDPVDRRRDGRPPTPNRAGGGGTVR